ncbi:MAG: hypothetical protein AAF251_00485 [Pseudomonadota bacterium]
MQEPRAKPLSAKDFRGDFFHEWLDSRVVIEGDQAEWLAANIRDPEFFHLTALSDLPNHEESVLEWILEQPECSVGTALYVYLIGMNFDPLKIEDVEWSMVAFSWPRHGDLKLQAAKGLREGRYKMHAYHVEGNYPAYWSLKTAFPNEKLFAMVKALPVDHPMYIPPSLLDLKWDRVAENRFDWEFDGMMYKFVEAYPQYGLRRSKETFGKDYADKPRSRPRHQSSAQKARQFREAAPILGAIAVGVLGSFLKRRR